MYERIVIVGAAFENAVMSPSATTRYALAADAYVTSTEEKSAVHAPPASTVTVREAYGEYRYTWTDDPAGAVPETVSCTGSTAPIAIAPTTSRSVSDPSLTVSSSPGTRSTLKSEPR